MWQRFLLITLVLSMTFASPLQDYDDFFDLSVEDVPLQENFDGTDIDFYLSQSSAPGKSRQMMFLASQFKIILNDKSLYIHVLAYRIENQLQPSVKLRLGFQRSGQVHPKTAGNIFRNLSKKWCLGLYMHGWLFRVLSTLGVRRSVEWIVKICSRYVSTSCAISGLGSMRWRKPEEMEFGLLDLSCC